MPIFIVCVCVIVVCVERIISNLDVCSSHIQIIQASSWSSSSSTTCIKALVNALSFYVCNSIKSHTFLTVIVRPIDPTLLAQSVLDK